MITALIEADYADLANGKEVFQDTFKGSYNREYIFTGTEKNYEWDAVAIDSSELLRDDGLRVLDLGCGAGRVVREYNQRNPRANKAYGITAKSYGPTDAAIVVGNVHYLDDIYPADLGPVDRSMSKLMYRHLTDPLSVLAMMAGHIKKGGLMVHDSFEIQAKLGSLVASRVVSYLTRSGHFSLVGSKAADVQQDYVDSPRNSARKTTHIMPGMMLERKSPTDSIIELPVGYAINPKSGNWHYVAA